MRSIATGLTAFISRNRAVVVVAVVVALTSAGTTVAASLVLGGINTATNTTTLKTGKNAAVLQLTNTNANGGTSVKGLGITVPAGRAPITVNASAGKATNLNADLVDGMDASAFLPAGGKAGDSDALDGIDSTGFVRGNGVSRRGAIVRPPDGSASHFFLGYSFSDFAPSPWVGLYYLCPTNLANNGAVVLRNEGDETLNLFFDNGLTEPTYVQFAGNGSQYSIGTPRRGRAPVNPGPGCGRERPRSRSTRSIARLTATPRARLGTRIDQERTDSRAITAAVRSRRLHAWGCGQREPCRRGERPPLRAPLPRQRWLRVRALRAGRLSRPKGQRRSTPCCT